MQKKITFTMSEETIQKLKEISEETMIPQSKLVEKAINQILVEYRK